MTKEEQLYKYQISIKNLYLKITNSIDKKLLLECIDELSEQKKLWKTEDLLGLDFDKHLKDLIELKRNYNKSRSEILQRIWKYILDKSERKYLLDKIPRKIDQNDLLSFIRSRYFINEDYMDYIKIIQSYDITNPIEDTIYSIFEDSLSRDDKIKITCTVHITILRSVLYMICDPFFIRKTQEKPGRIILETRVILENYLNVLKTQSPLSSSLKTESFFNIIDLLLKIDSKNNKPEFSQIKYLLKRIKENLIKPEIV